MQNDSELLKNIRNEHGLSQEELAVRLDVTKGYISLVETGRSKLSADKRCLLEQIFTDTIRKNSAEFRAKYFLNVFGSCGGGVFEQSQEFEYITIPKFLVELYRPDKEYSVITAYGDSMTGSIEDGDKLIIENCDNSDGIKDNEIYVFSYEDEVYIKRLIRNVGQIIVKSDNKDIPQRYIEGENIKSFHIHGKVVGLVRNYLRKIV